MTLYNVNRNQITDVEAMLNKNGLIVVGSHRACGEEQFLSDMICYYDSLGKTVHVWDLDSISDNFEPEVFQCRVILHEIPIQMNSTWKTDSKRVLSQVMETEKSSVSVVIGYQNLHYNPYDPEETSLLMSRLQNGAENRTIIVFDYLGLYEAILEEDFLKYQKTLTTTEADLIRLGLPTENAILLEKIYEAKAISPFDAL